MAVFVSDSIRDNGLEHARQNASRVILTVGQPTTYANATTDHGSGSGQRAVEDTVAPGDFTLSSITGGRRVGLGLITGLTPEVNANGVNHWCWVDDVNNEILAYADVNPAIDVTTSGTVNIQGHGVRLEAGVLHVE